MPDQLPHDFPSISSAVRAIRRGELDPRQLVEDCLARIDRDESRIRAWVSVDRDGARREAERSWDLARNGRATGRLHGIPVGIKDIIDVQGMATAAGSATRADWIAGDDAPLVARLRREGAIVLGKTVTTEFACFDPSPTRNPWNVRHTPGGSSSGSAAAVALGMCWAALGSQTGGSITRPAAYCGVVGFKPTWTSPPAEGVVPVSFHLDHVGTLTRTVDDARQIAIGCLPCSTLMDREAASDSRPVVAVIENDFWDRCDPAVTAATRAAIERLVSAEATLVGSRFPDSIDEVLASHRRIMAVEAAHYHEPWFDRNRRHYGRRVAELIDEGRATSRHDYVSALLHRLRFQAAVDSLFHDTDPPIDVLVCPSTTTPAPSGLDSTGDPSANSPWSFAGVPTVTVPCGLSADGLPCGLQLVGRLGEDERLLRIAAWCETILAFRHSHSPPPVPETDPP